MTTRQLVDDLHALETAGFEAPSIRISLRRDSAYYELRVRYGRRTLTRTFAVHLDSNCYSEVERRQLWEAIDGLKLWARDPDSAR